MKIKNASDLKLAIIELERKSIDQKEILNDRFHETYESLKPRNLIHSTVTNITGSEKITNSIFNALPALAITAATGILSKKLLGGISSKFIRRIGRSLINIAISRVKRKYTHKIKNAGSNFLKQIVSKLIN